jgi:hypothetical protein
MIMPSKVIKPVDSLISLSSTIIEILKENSMNIDDLLIEFNARYYKKITIEKLILCLDFLFIIDKIKDESEIITINI